MASAPKQVNGNGSNNNSSLGKRKKSRGSKSSYLSKWLDKAMHQIQDATPNRDTNDFVNANNMNIGNWPITASQFAPGYDPYRYSMYGSAEPMSLPTLPSYCPTMPPFYGPGHTYIQGVNKNRQVQRPRLRRRNDHKAEEINSTDSGMEPKVSPDNQDYASLPLITSVTDTNSVSDMHEKEKDDEENRRFSDPCVQALPDVTQPVNAESDSDESSNMSGSQVGGRLLTCLLDQITSLKVANERLNKDLLDTRAELDNMRHHIMLHKGSSSSMGATPNHSLDNGVPGGHYAPGFLTDLVREIRDAARIREEAMYTRVRAMVLERTENMASSEAKSTEKALDDIKSTMRASEADKRRMMDRINKLEDEIHSLRLASGFENENKITNGNIEDSETERLRLRKELADLRKAKQSAEDHSHKLERLVTQLRSKFNGHQLTNGPDSLPSEAEHEPNVRVRRTSINSSTNSTVVFGPVTDL